MSMGSDMYREQILDHYKNPRNYGELEEHTFSHLGENPMCGDEIEVFVRLDDEDRIEYASFRGDGCAISQASASMLTSHIRGMTMAELHDLDTDDVLDLLGIEVTPMRVKCAVLAEKVAQDGAEIYEGEREAEKTTTE
ncbi:Fe-S cluster assembly sulfur transfer protein SufU [Natronorarus salvus]|uniref:Fe-S cluster assembly sulfur transfer protein SufU n=1 Tax=Natronorarus salvus TaxID=3117733 RepID=UPI002F268C78